MNASLSVHDFYRRNSLRVLEIPVGVKCPVVVGWPEINKDCNDVDVALANPAFNKYGWLLDDEHLVIDIDIHTAEANGIEALKRLEDDCGVDINDACGAVVYSPSGGMHFYFKKPPGVKFGKVFNEKYAGIDFIHGKGKQVIAANSCHDKFGGFYKLDEPAELLDAPAKLLEYLVAMRAPEKPAVYVQPTGDRSGDEFNTSPRGLQIMVGALQSRGYSVTPSHGFYKFNRPGKTTDSDCSGHVGKKSKHNNYQLTCFSLSDLHFPSGESLSMFHAYALLLHQGNHTAASEDLHRLGFASQPTNIGNVNFNEFMPGPPASKAEHQAYTVEPPCFPMDTIDDTPKMLRLAYEYSRQNSILFMPEACMFGLIALFSSILGRRVRDDYNSRTNPIIIVLAKSGTGKNSQRECNKNLLVSAGLTHLSGPERIGSAQGIVTAVHRQPSILFQLDEAADLLAAINNPRSHLQNLPGLMMHMYSDCKSTWTSDAVSDERRVKTIHQPNPVYYGTSTPDKFYENISEGQLVDGFMNRMIMVLCNSPQKRRKPSLTEPSRELLDWMKSWACLQTGSGNLADSGVEIPKPWLVNKTAEASDMHEEYTDNVLSRHKNESAIRQSLWARAPEKEAKLALVYACACGLPTEGPVITAEAITWAKRLVNYSIRFMVWAAEERTQNTESLKQKQRVLDKIETGMSRVQVTRKTQFLRNRRERDEIISELQDCGCISFDVQNNSFQKIQGIIR